MALEDVYFQIALCKLIIPCGALLFLAYSFRDRLHECWLGFLAAYVDHLQTKLYSRYSERAKRRLFADVHDLANRMQCGDTVNVVEMECTGGVNFGFYPDDIRLICSSGNPAAEKYIRHAAQGHANLRVEYLTDHRNKTKGLSDNSADVVVATFALSGIDDARVSLKEAKRVLKPGGQLLFVDHVAAKPGSWLAYFQNLFNRFFLFLLQGHHVNRDLETAIRKAGFAKIKMDHFSGGFWFPLNVINPCISGKAIKAL